MRKSGSGGSPLGLLMVLAGVLIILALVLPTAFWWFMLGIVLVALGILFCRRH